MTPKMSPRLQLVLIAALFLIPLLFAWMMYNGTIAYKPAATRNFGTLVQPPRPLGWDHAEVVPEEQATGDPAPGAFNDHWVILYPLPDRCLENCLRKITALRQIHLASGRQQNRIRIALLVPETLDAASETMLRQTYPKFDLVRDATGQVRRTLAETADGPDVVYLIDPLGNIMMTYEAGTDPNDLKRDLKRLLTWSKLDEQ